MIASLRQFLGWMVSAFSSYEDLVLENLALRRQLLALHVQRTRHRLTALHRLFWVALRTFWSGWRKPLVLVTPRTVMTGIEQGFVCNYHEDRTHLGLAKDTPTGRPTEYRSKAESKIQSFPRLGGLHHRYAVAA